MYNNLPEDTNLKVSCIKNYTYATNIPLPKVVVHPRTFRPVYGGIKQLANEAYGKKFVSAHNLFIQFTNSKKKYPTSDELILYFKDIVRCTVKASTIYKICIKDNSIIIIHWYCRINHKEDKELLILQNQYNNNG